MDAKRFCSGMIVVWILMLAPGCAEQGTYAVRMRTPWPDECVTSRAGTTVEDRPVLAPPTVAWHGRTDPSELLAAVESRTAGHDEVYTWTRRALARRVDGTGPAGLWFVEVRLGRRFFGSERVEPMDLSYDGPLGDLLDRLAVRVMTPIGVGAGVSRDAVVHIHARQTDPRAALVRVLTEQGLFVREWDFLPLTVRSYEYPRREEFLAAIVRIAGQLQARARPAEWTVVAFDEWRRRASASQHELLARIAREQSGRRRFGNYRGPVALPTPTLLASRPEEARRQVMFATAAHLLPGETVILAKSTIGGRARP